MTHDQNIIGILFKHAKEKPNDLAYAFLRDGHDDSDRITYRELAQSVATLSKRLNALGARGERAILAYPQGIDFIIGFLASIASGIIAIPAPPPEAGRLKRTRPRLNSILDDAGARLILSTDSIIELLNKAGTESSTLSQAAKINTKSHRAHKGEIISSEIIYDNSNINPIAYLQYTSGSTSSPKGVKVGNLGLINNINSIIQHEQYDNNSITITWMPYYHDYGLIEGILVPLVNGTPCYIMSPFSFLKKPSHWLRGITKYKATHTQAPNFAYKMCVDRIKDEELSNIDLSSLKCAANAAEPLNLQDMRRFHERFLSLGFTWSKFSPAYGLAEYILLATATAPTTAPDVSTFDKAALENLEVVPCHGSERCVELIASGTAAPGARIAIIDPETRKRCPSTRIGEIWLKVEDAEAGYWGDAIKSQEIFEAKIADAEDSDDYLRTGDMGFLYNNHIFITGRIKDMIIINGVNYWPQDIEWAIGRAHDAVMKNNGCAAFAIDKAGEEAIGVVVEVSRGFLDFEDLYTKAMIELSESTGAPIADFYIVKPGSIPKTSSGKISRSAGKRSLEDGTLHVLWSSNELGHKTPAVTQDPADQNGDGALADWLCAEIAEVAQIERSQIHASQSIMSFGIDSVGLTTLGLAIEEKTGRYIPIFEIGKAGRTVQGLIDIIEAQNTEYSSSALVPLREGGRFEPIFFVHPAGGNAIGYSKLVENLISDRPCYGIQAYGFVEGVEPLRSIEQMASRYLEEIKLVQPVGPYFLSGMCLGGMIAYEMACILERRGERVGLLVLMDPRSPPALLRQFEQRGEDDSDPQFSSGYFENLRAEAAGKPSTSIPDNLFATDPLSVKVQQANKAARDGYVPGSYGGPVHFFWANQSSGALGYQHDPRALWVWLFKGAYTLHEIDCDHFRILEEPSLSQVSSQMSSILAELE